MSTVDEILESGRYADRRGREWQCRPNWTTPSGRGVWEHAVRLANVPGGITFDILDPDQMRLLIERDQHRATCPGLWDCRDHPVPTVTISRLFRPRIYVNDFGMKRTLSEAIDDARALAVLNV